MPPRAHHTGGMQVPRVVPPLVATLQEHERAERRRLSGLLDGTIDAHTHLFPDAIYAAMLRWFDAHAWEIVFRGNADATIAHLHAHGTPRFVALVFAHKPGVARWLNQFLADTIRAQPGIVGVGTVMPGEPDAADIVRDAVGRLGLRGIKLHCHVQRMAIDDPRVVEVLRVCQALRVPAVVHAGREPASDAYGVDCHAICAVDRTERVLQALPDLQLVVPHVGADEYAPYLQLTRQYPNLWLDTAMACADYFETHPAWPLLESCADRVLLGTDFPIIPYPVDRERTVLAQRIVDDTALAAILGGNAARLWGF